MEEQIYYRPEWTCGRFNEPHKAAIFYNLIEGMSYLFDEYSAIVVDKILAVGRNGVVTCSELSSQTGIAEESILPFMQKLLSLNLLTLSKPTPEGIKDYRSQVSRYKCQHSQTVKKTTKEKLPMEVSNAEMEYTDMVGGITSVMFELTYNCSEKCIHCYNMGATRNDTEVSHRGDRVELDLQDYKRIIDELYEQGLIKVCLSGGDPFSKPFAWDIISYLYEKEIAFDVFTNGQRIVNDVEKLAGYYPRLVGVSIYSGSAEVHDSITRIKGSCEKSMKVVGQLSDLAVTTALKCCIMRPNVKTYDEVADIARRIGATVQYEVSVTDSIEGDKCVSKHLRLSPDLLEIVLRDDNIPLYVGKEAPNFGGQKRRMDCNACGAGKNTFCITPEGYLIPCCALHLQFGNLKEHSLKEIIHNNEKLDWWQHLTLEQYDECGRYDYCDYCNLCPGINYSEHGTSLKAGENNCYVAKTRFELAHKMMNSYDPLKGKTLKETLATLPSYHKEMLQREK